MADNTVQDLLRSVNVTESVSPRKLVSRALGNERRELLRTGLGESLLIGAGRSVYQTGQGIKQLALQAGEAVGLVEEGAADDYTRRITEEARLYESTPVGQSAAGRVGEFAGDLLMLAGPSQIAGGTVKGAAFLAGTEGLIQPVYGEGVTASDRLTNAAIFATTGGVFQKAINMTPVLINKMKEGTGKITAATPTRRGIEGMNAEQKQVVNDTVEAARRLNTFVTPAETTQDLIAKQREAGLTLFGDPKRRLLQRVEDRENLLQGKVNDLVNELVPEGTTAARQAARELADSAYSKELKYFTSDEIVEGSDLLTKALDQVRGSGRQDIIRREGGSAVIRENTVGELHLMRLVLDGWFENMPEFANRNLLSAARKDLVGIADLAAPEYALSRNVNQRILLQNKIKNALDKANEGVRPTTTFYKEFLQSKKKTDEFTLSLKNITDSNVRKNVEKNLAVLEPVLRAVHSSPLDVSLGLRRDVKLQAAGVGGARGVLANFTANVVAGKMDDALVRFITSPSWVDSYNKAVKSVKSKQTKARILMQMFQKYVAATIPAAAAAAMFSPSP